MAWKLVDMTKKVLSCIMYLPRLSFTVHEMVGMFLTNTMLGGNNGTAKNGERYGLALHFGRKKVAILKMDLNMTLNPTLSPRSSSSLRVNVSFSSRPSGKCSARPIPMSSAILVSRTLEYSK